MSTIQSLRVLEGAAALALLFAPEKIKEYLKEIGVEPVEVEKTDAIFNIHNLAESRGKQK